MIKENGVPCAKAFTKWSASKNVWQARASLVAFANYTKHSEYKLLMLGSCSKLIRREERFAKTAVGWILRELSKTNKNMVIAFIRKYGGYFSKESLENGIKSLSALEKEKLRKCADEK
jgi:3-methyladenine DNA glycosylase AlkD